MMQVKRTEREFVPNKETLKEARINREKDETAHPWKDPAQEAGMSL